MRHTEPMSIKSQLIIAVIVVAVLMPIALPTIVSISNYERLNKSSSSGPPDISNRDLAAVVIVAYVELYQEHRVMLNHIERSIENAR